MTFFVCLFFSLPVEVDCSDGDAVGGITLKSNPPSAACTPKKNMYQKIGGKNDATKARAHYDIIWSKFFGLRF